MYTTSRMCSCAHTLDNSGILVKDTRTRLSTRTHAVILVLQWILIPRGTIIVLILMFLVHLLKGWYKYTHEHIRKNLEKNQSILFRDCHHVTDLFLLPAFWDNVTLLRIFTGSLMQLSFPSRGIRPS